MSWLDSHSHIVDEAFEEDRDEVLTRMVEAGVHKVMVVCMSVEEAKKAFSLQKEEIYFDIALGIHPQDQKKMDEKSYQEMAELAKDERVVAIGEIGLDYYWDKDNKEEQKELFLRQISLAKKLKKPIIVHSRDAIRDTYDILKAHPVAGVMHCYSDSKEMAKEFLKLGMYISLSGTVTFKNAREPKEVAKIVPLNRLLIETDCPYLAPVPYRGKRNEPSYVKATGQFLAEWLNIPEEELSKQIDQNYEALFHGGCEELQ